MIHALESRLGFYEGPDSKGTMKRVKELQSQVARAESEGRGGERETMRGCIVEPAVRGGEASDTLTGRQACKKKGRGSELGGCSHR